MSEPQEGGIDAAQLPASATGRVDAPGGGDPSPAPSWLPAKLAYYEDDNGRPGKLIPPDAVPFTSVTFWYCAEGHRAYWVAVVREEGP